MNAVELYDPATDTWRAGPPLNENRWLHKAVAITAGDGGVVVAGGAGLMGPLGAVELLIP